MSPSPGLAQLLPEVYIAKDFTARSVIAENNCITLYPACSLHVSKRAGHTIHPDIKTHGQRVIPTQKTGVPVTPQNNTRHCILLVSVGHLCDPPAGFAVSQNFFRLFYVMKKDVTDKTHKYDVT